MTNLYGLLGVKPSASAEEIKAAYRMLALVHHPDHNNGQDERFKEIGAAYGVLSDSSLRMSFDSKREAWLRARSAVPCPSCGAGNRIRADAPSIVSCGRCKESLPVPADLRNHGVPDQGDVMRTIAERRRRHGEKLGNQVLLETADVAAQISDELVAEVTTLAVAGIRVGLRTIRKRLGLTEDGEPKRKRKSRAGKSPVSTVSKQEE